MSEDNLRRGSAGVLLLTGLGLAYVLIGNYVAWGFALASGGVGGLLVALVIVSVAFFCLVGCLGELAAMMPSAGAGFEYVRRGLGIRLGWMAGSAILLEYVCGTAALAAFSASYIGVLTGASKDVTIVSLFVVVGLLHAIGVGEALSVTLAVAAVAIIGVFAYVAALIPSMSWAHVLDAAPQAGSAAWFPHGWTGVWAAIPFVVTFFITIEGVSFAAEEARAPERTIPAAMYAALLIAVGLAVIVCIVGPAGAGATLLAGTPDPMAAALRAVSGSPTAHWASVYVNYAGAAGLAASFFGGLFASSRLLFHFARVDILPRVLARTNARHAPWVAVVASSIAGLFLALAADTEQLVVIFVCVATASYLLMLAAHARLRRIQPDAPRPYRTPAGYLMPIVGSVLALIIFVACFLADVRFSTLGLVLMGILAALLMHGGRRASSAAS